jgi:hypothetical protein
VRRKEEEEGRGKKRREGSGVNNNVKAISNNSVEDCKIFRMMGT